MAGTCKGICSKYYSKVIRTKIYQDNGKRCMTCGGITLKCEGVWCPCCKCRLRTRSRHVWITRRKNNNGV